MEKTLVYGLGKVFNENKNQILQDYNVAAYCDADDNKISNISGGGYL